MERNHPLEFMNRVEIDQWDLRSCKIWDYNKDTSINGLKLDKYQVFANWKSQAAGSAFQYRKIRDVYFITPQIN